MNEKKSSKDLKTAVEKEKMPHGLVAKKKKKNNSIIEFGIFCLLYQHRI